MNLKSIYDKRKKPDKKNPYDAIHMTLWGKQRDNTQISVYQGGREVVRCQGADRTLQGDRITLLL